MKQLTCEMCGSTNLMKQDGVFVCQSCGTKYSVEEAKKMMVEGTVEVQGVVHVANTAQVSNLLNMATSAFDSKNFSKAEDFCDQAIAMDDKNYEAWMLKGRAINYQISATNHRILEVYNCIMSAYRTLNDDGSDADTHAKTLEVVAALRECMEGEVDFWVKQIEAKRPTDAVLNKVKSTHIACYNMMLEAYEEMGYDSDTYLKNFDTHFCKVCNSICVDAWSSTVAYNYFRDGLDDLGKDWNRNPRRTENGTDYFRPNESIRETFMDESGNLIQLLEYCIEQFNDLTPLSLQVNIFENLSYIYNVRKDQVSYKAMVSTTTNGYGAVTNRYEYYEIDRSLTSEAVNINRKQAQHFETLAKITKEQIKVQKIAEYWTEHAEEKAALESEKVALNEKISSLRASIDKVPEISLIQPLKSEIEKLKQQKESLGLFKSKEKKALQEQIDLLNQKLSSTIAAKDKVVNPILAEIAQLEKRVEEIKKELTKER